ncbi:OLC1v1026899C1 [Oldenlandia corymbosa var. corymbosa]|nr:OLC1v1026899C1 [Oldenlandia corymbosa var. corymbosa]
MVVKFVPEMQPGMEMHGHDLSAVNEPLSLRRSKRRFMQPERYLGCDMPEFEVEITQLGERKMYKCDSDEEYKELPLALSIQADHEHQKNEKVGSSKPSGERKSKNVSSKHVESSASEKAESARPGPSQSIREKKQSHPSQLSLVPQSISSEGKSILRELDAPEDHLGNVDLISKYLYEAGSKRAYKKKIAQPIFMKNERGLLVPRYRKIYKRKAFCVRSEWESIYNMKPSGKKSITAAACRELLERCMQNIDATINVEQPPIIDQWKEFKSMNFQDRNEDNEKATESAKEEISEIDMLWNEMELALASFYFLDDNEDSQAFMANVNLSDEHVRNGCQHDYRLNEEIGVICRLCGFVLTEIKDVSPPVWSSTNSANSYVNKEQKNEEDSEKKPKAPADLDNFHVPATSNLPSAASEGEENVWALIPELGSKLRVHQKRAFEFLWRNIAGSLVPAQMEENQKKRGGCVISHTPGAGKTLLIITFLVSYLKLFPGSRPLVLAPKTTLYTWYKEIIKWKIPIPVYQIHGGQTYKGEVLRQRMRSSPGLPRNQDFMHVLDCLEKMQKWLSHPSVLLMGYTSFLTLTREGSNYAHRKYMAQVLRQCPGILILDEGHNPRSTKSRLRKALMKVDTKLRVLLSGTLFQNNFGEYFNTLCLARPTFVKEVLKELDPKWNKSGKSSFSRENRSRKIFIDKMSRMIDSNEAEERLEGLNILKNLTGKFIDVYEGGSADNLPGLQCYTLMTKSTSLQQSLLDKLQNQRPVFKGFPLELELLITLAAIHPWLIRTTSCSNQYFSPEELEDLEKTKFDVKFGAKVRFIMSLVPKCILRREKILIFCHNIAPINLLLELFSNIFNWRKGREVLVLQGDIELFERGRVMDKFEEPGGPSKIMLASITACAEGISLTAASRVILLDSEWNPSKSKQAIARAFRPGQDKVVYVYQLLAAGTLEEEKYSRTTWKEWVSSMIFSEELVEDPSHWQAPKIEDEMLREIVEEDRAALFHRIMKIEKASSVIREPEVKNNPSSSERAAAE